jgi:hypothetical protein
MAAAHERERESARALKELMFKPVPKPTSKQLVATVLARSREPILAREIQELIELHFEAEPPTAAEVRDILTSCSEFTQPERYRWQFGRLAGPWKGELAS